MIDRQMKAAESYAALGWKLFVVTADKQPRANCGKCGLNSGCGGKECGCGNFCHGFYAATDNIDHIRVMLWRTGNGLLALRTGSASGGIAVIDAEGDDADGYGLTGLEILDDITTWTDGKIQQLDTTLRQKTSGGGVHLLYRLPEGMSVSSRNRALPNMDIKAEGGYVVLPPGGGRSWLDWFWAGSNEGGKVVEPSADILNWLAQGTRVSSTDSTGSGILALRREPVIPAGSRYDFTQALTYHLRRSGVDWDDAVRVCEEEWNKFQQPANGTRVSDGVWFMPLRQVMYELERAWHRVEPETPVSFQQMAWARTVSGL